MVGIDWLPLIPGGGGRGLSPPGQSCVVPPWSAPDPFELLGAIEKIKISDFC